MKIKFLSLCIVLSAVVANAQKTDNVIVLNAPDINRGEPVMKALSQRASARVFTSTQLKLQDLSDLLWAANGINRPDEKKRTAASAVNAQDIDVYTFMQSGTYLYDASAHQLVLVAEGDNRSIFSRNENETLPALICLLVSDISRFRMGDDAQKREMAAMDAGIVSQNIAVFCASVGLLTRPRAMMNKPKIKELLQLSDSQIPMLNLPVSYKE
ncbi:MAG: SagB/ThcOx family dehydrogenase [Dysgonamonadaceae bacterium]|jgi:SagB-type dehydrogenase family enzyme|nr:SagB/ThcOx family dehydrogenase [Dysgonamonadaceae bacterium]